MRKGIEQLANGQCKQAIQNWFEQDVGTRFQDRILAADLEVCLRCGKLSATSARMGRPRPVIDTLLASTALVHDLVLVTRNERDFEHLPVRVINPWT